MKTKKMMVLTGVLLLAGGTTVFGMSGESVEGTETKAECQVQGEKKSCGDKKSGEGKKKYRNRKGGKGRGENFEHYGRRDNDGGKGRGCPQFAKPAPHGPRGPQLAKPAPHGPRGPQLAKPVPRGPQFANKRTQHGQMMGKMLNLTEEQHAQIKAFKTKNSEKNRQSYKALGDAHKALRDATQAETFDEAKIRALSKKLADKIADVAIAKAKGMKEFKALLTEEQQAKLAAKKAEFAKRMVAMKNKHAAARAGKNVKKATE